MDAIQISNGTQTLSDGDTLNRGNPSNHCKITNEQNKPLLPGKYLGQLNHRPPTVKSRESHEVSEIGERGPPEHHLSLLEDTTIRLSSSS